MCPVGTAQCSRPRTFLFVSDWHPSIFFLVHRALPNLQIILSAKPSITVDHKSYSKPKWNSNCSFLGSNCIGINLSEQIILSQARSHANLSWFDVIGTGLDFHFFFWESKVSVKLNFLIHQSWANCCVGCWKVYHWDYLADYAGCCRMGQIPLYPSGIFNKHCLCVFSRL